MAYNLVIVEEAYLETLEAYNYYEEKQQGLGETFLLSLQKRYIDLSRNPQYYSFISNDSAQIFRDVKVDKFPYVVIFEISETDVIIYSVHLTHKRSRH